MFVELWWFWRVFFLVGCPKWLPCVVVHSLVMVGGCSQWLAFIGSVRVRRLSAVVFVGDADRLWRCVIPVGGYD